VREFLRNLTFDLRREPAAHMIWFSFLGLFALFVYAMYLHRDPVYKYQYVQVFDQTLECRSVK
jgi:uncharacterized membrane protein